MLNLKNITSFLFGEPKTQLEEIEMCTSIRKNNTMIYNIKTVTFYYIF